MVFLMYLMWRERGERSLTTRREKGRLADVKEKKKEKKRRKGKKLKHILWKGQTTTPWPVGNFHANQSYRQRS